MSTLRIREIEPGDEPRVLELTKEFLQLSPYTALFPPKDGHLEDLYARLVKLGKIFVAVNRDNYPVGLIAGAVLPHAMNGELYAEGVIWYVDKGHRGGDVGRNLLGVFAEWTTTNGATVLKMSAPSDSPVGKLLGVMGFAAFETHFVLPLATPTAKVVRLEGVTADDLQRHVRRERPGGTSDEPATADSHGQHDDADGASSNDVDRTDSPA
jgi:hypothetical protein